MRAHEIPAGVLPTQRGLYYGGAWHAPMAGGKAETFNPTYNEAITTAPIADAADVDAAVQAAHAAFPAWAATPPVERGRYLRKAAAVLREHAKPLALLDSLNNGNPVSALAMDAGFAADCLDYFAGLATEIKGETIPMGDGNFNYTMQEPLGVIARIVAYNHPFMFAAARLAAPLAAGNTVVVKSPDQAPLSILRLAELVGDIFPPGVANFLCGGRECGDAMGKHPLVRKITLIGGVPTGKAVMKTASDNLKPVLLELGGKNALIGYPDADIDKLVNGIIGGMNFTWSGQSCGSTSRVFCTNPSTTRCWRKSSSCCPSATSPASRPTRKPPWARWSAARNSKKCRATSPRAWKTAAAWCAAASSRPTRRSRTASSTKPPCLPT
jgi:betaine-aldehyde dehydrogenase